MSTSPSNKDIPVRTRRLREFLDRRIALLKRDIEGDERDVLEERTILDGIARAAKLHDSRHAAGVYLME